MLDTLSSDECVTTKTLIYDIGTFMFAEFLAAYIKIGNRYAL